MEALAAEQAAQIAVGQWVRTAQPVNLWGRLSKTTPSGLDPAVRDWGEAFPETTGRGWCWFWNGGEDCGAGRSLFGREIVRSGQQRDFHTFYVEFTGTINRMLVVEE